MKSGPNGQAIATSTYDLGHLPPSLIDDIKLVGGDDLSSKIDELIDGDGHLIKQ